METLDSVSFKIKAHGSISMRKSIDSLPLTCPELPRICRPITAACRQLKMEGVDSDFGLGILGMILKYRRHPWGSPRLSLVTGSGAVIVL